jgi:hypothetical protein
MKLKFSSDAFNAGADLDIPWDNAYLAIRSDGWALLMMGIGEYVCASATLKPDDLAQFLKAIDGVSI